MVKAVIFDMYETLITLYNSELYKGKQIATDMKLPEPIRNSQLGDNLANPHFHDHGDHWHNSNPNVSWAETLEHAEKIGIGTRQYELVTMK